MANLKARRFRVDIEIYMRRTMAQTKQMSQSFDIRKHCSDGALAFQLVIVVNEHGLKRFVTLSSLRITLVKRTVSL